MKAIKRTSPKAEKKLMRFAVLLIISSLLSGAKVEAQIDPSSAMLLNSRPADVREGGIDSGRYTIKPRSDAPKKTRVRAEAVSPTPTPAPSLVPAAAVAPIPSSSPVPSSASAVANPVAVVIVAPTPTPIPIPTATPFPIVGPQDPNFGPQSPRSPQAPHGPQQVDSDTQDLGGSAPPAIDVNRDERRFTLLELSFAPGYLYNDSKSTFTPRNYSVNAPTAMVDATVWTTPEFGVHTNFNSTLNANIPDSYNDTVNVPVSEQWFSAGLKARSFFGDGRLAPTLTIGVDYREFEFRTPSDTVFRNKLTTTGLILLLDAELPTGGFGSWTLGGEFGPALSHRESSNAIDFRSGDSPKTTSVGVHFGANYRFDHTQSLFWKVSYAVEKNLFENSTTMSDPTTGLPQTNVSVTNSFTMFQLGYTWGD